MEIIVWRIYDKPLPNGYKILVDGLWPRGIKKDFIDHWAKEIAPSPDLRKWYSHDLKKWDGFIEKYRKEILANSFLDNFIGLLKEKLKEDNVIFLFASKEKSYNNANALKEIIEKLL